MNRNQEYIDLLEALESSAPDLQESIRKAQTRRNRRSRTVHLLSGMAACLAAVVLIAASTAGLTAPHSAAAEHDAMEAAQTQLELLGAGDAELLGKPENDVTGEPCLIFYSEAQDQQYEFDLDGRLRLIHGSYMLLGPGEGPELSELPKTDVEELGARMDAFAQTCVAPDLIGTLECVEHKNSQFDIMYTYYEYYDGVETGTRVALMCANDGSLLSAVIHYGEVFERLEDGTVRCRITAAVTEEQARQIAMDALKEKVKSIGESLDMDSVTAKLGAEGNVMYYSLEAKTEGAMGHEFTVQVDISDGSIYRIISCA